jgi:uncharacterized membrane protein YeaQ/YmgE (transglycosylase-associated protein family)
MFSRATMFITLLSAAVVAIALVAQATAFGPDARTFALLVLPVVLLIGIMTYFRLGEANSSDIGLVIGMNRVRHAYLELAPELEPYFTASRYDDHAGIGASYGAGYRYTAGRVLGGTPALVAIINVVLAGAIATLVAQAFGIGARADVILGIIGAVGLAAIQATLVIRAMRQGRADYRPRFPHPDR